MSALVGIIVGFLVRKATPWISGVKDREGIRWPWPEAVGALLFGLAGWRVEALVYSTLLMAVLTADFRYKLIPDKVTYPGTAVGILVSILWPGFITTHFQQHLLLKTIGASGGFPLALGGALVGFAVFEGFRRIMSRIASMEVMGMGDSKLVMMMGAFLGPWGVLLALFPGMLCGLVIGVIYTRIMKSPHFPFGPALGLGGWITLLWPNLVGDGIGWMQELGRKADRGVLIVVNIALLAVAVWLMLRVRKRSKEYTDAIEKDYSKLEDREKD
ncbi:MAG: prepilin peptidase [Planctomycetota bacterium]|jgi:prepilin signal peptidase PulO-like enzyme (type II secretory pathway)